MAITIRKSFLMGLGLFASVTIIGCSGGGTATEATPSPTISASASATPVPKATAKPNTPDPHFSPLGGKPPTEEEKQYHKLKQKGQNLFLSKDYKGAIPVLEQALEEQPEDVENSFYLLMSHGSLSPVPSKNSPAYPYAKKVFALDKGSSEANRARDYLVAAEFEVPDGFQYGKDTFFSKGGYVLAAETPYKLQTDAPLHAQLPARLTKDGKATLWEAEIAPKYVEGTVELKKGTEVHVISEDHYYHSLTSWRKPLRGEPKGKDLNDSVFELAVFYVEVVSEGSEKGKKGWMVNQMDRCLDPSREDPFGTWIPSRLNVERPE